MILDVVSSVLMVSGCLFAVLAGVGLLRLPDVFARMHAATKPATLGMVLVGIGAMFRADTWPDITVLALVVALQFLTNPIGAHLVGRAAYHAGGEVDPATHTDELAEARVAPTEG
jgi:multicomponent Na+:H+ antiporter subunit G